jgi:hypothetical protein
MYKNAFVCFVALVTVSLLNINATCKKQKSKQVEKITVGSGGGFTGATKEYTINKDGSVLLLQGSKKEGEGFGKISKKHLHEITRKSVQAGFQSLELNEPGNFYYYIEITEKGKSHRVIWSSQNSENGKKMQELYTYIMDIILKSKKQ